jgi:hypothetical protein
MDLAAQERTGREHHGAGLSEFAPALDPEHPTIDSQEIVHLALKDLEPRLLPEGMLGRLGVETTIRLRTGAPYSGPLAAVQNTELNPRPVNCLAHDSAQSIDLPNEVTPTQTPDSWIAGHGADAVLPLGYKQRPRAAPGRCRRGFNAGVPATNDNDIMVLHGRGLWATCTDRSRRSRDSGEPNLLSPPALSG